MEGDYPLSSSKDLRNFDPLTMLVGSDTCSISTLGAARGSVLSILSNTAFSSPLFLSTRSVLFDERDRLGFNVTL